MKSTRWISVPFLSLLLLSACSDTTPADPLSVDPQFAKQGPKPGKAAYALEFSGDQWAQAPFAADLNLGSTFTLELWIKPSQLVTRQDMVSRWGSGTMASFNFNLKDAMVNLSTRQEAFGNTPARTGDILTLGEWQHIAVSFDNGTARIYLNGELQLTQPEMHVPQDNTQIFSLGREAGYDGSYFFGQMDDVRIWTAARTEGQIQAPMMNVKRKDRANLIAWWKFDEGEGDIAYDAVGGHHLQLGDAVGPDAGDPVWVREPNKR